MKELHRHVENYGPARLESLYREAVQHCRDQGLTLGRPGGLTNILPAIAAGTAGGRGSGVTRYPDEPEYHVMSQAEWDNAEVGEPNL